jgi:hypothetical protein
VRAAMKNINVDVNENEENISFIDSSIQSLFLKKSINDTMLLSGSLYEIDSIAFEDSNTNIMADISNLITQDNTMLTLFTEGRETVVADVKDLNDAITGTSTLEINEQQFTDVYLRNLALGIDTMSSIDLVILKDIAVQCPFSGGRAVIKARAYLAIIGDSTEYDDETVCLADTNFRKASYKNVKAYGVRVSPNPLTDNCTFYYSLPKDESAELRIFNSLGKEIIYQPLPPNSTAYKFQFRNYSEGIFTYSIYSTSGLIGNGKIVLIK